MTRRRLRPDEVAAIHTWARRGMIPCCRLGRAVRFLLAEVEQWMSHRTRVPKDMPGSQGARR